MDGTIKIFVFAIVMTLLISFASALTIDEINQNSENTPVIFFKTSTCPVCKTIDAWVQSIEENYPNVDFIRININDEYELIQKLYENYGVPTDKQNRVPIIFVGDTYFYGGNEPREGLENKLNSLQEKNLLLNESNINQNSTEVNLAYITGLALVDAINPCELAVLIILMTAILTRFPNQKSKALKAGLAFSGAIFLIYFIFGLLLREVFGFITNVLGATETGFFLFLGILAIIIGLLNLKDGINYGGGGFILEVPQSWRPKMKSLIEGTTSPAGAFVVGLIVAFFLTPCTAGPYLVFSGIISKVTLLTALPYLIIYMLIFISPMIIITLITYFGFAKVEDMGGWRENNIKKLHLVAGILMILVGIYMLLTSFGIM
jgi:thiol-disulfide isomerase/thioredoxin